MLALLLTLAAALAPAQAGETRPAAQPPQAQDALESELAALAKEFGAAYAEYGKRLDALRKQGEARPESKIEHPAVAFWARTEALAQRGAAGARLWMALQFANAHPGMPAAERDPAWRAHLLAAVEAGANAPFARDLSRAFTLLYLDAPAALVDEALEAFVARTTQRELAADALYRASLAKRRDTQELASSKAAEFGKRLAADFGDTAVARAARGEAEVGLALGKLAPDFTAKDADGASFKLSDYRGKVVVLDFWGFW
jgi:hypothetical protein